MAYFDHAALFTHLLRGGRADQFLGSVTLSGVTGLRWLELRPALKGIELWVFDVQDVGAPGHTDLYAFPVLNEEIMPFAVATFATSREVERYAEQQYAASPLRWAPPPQAREDYAEWLKANGSPRRALPSADFDEI